MPEIIWKKKKKKYRLTPVEGAVHKNYVPLERDGTSKPQKRKYRIPHFYPKRRRTIKGWGPEITSSYPGFWAVSFYLSKVYYINMYSETSITQTPMARLPWLSRISFLVPMKFLRQLKKTILGIVLECALFYQENVSMGKKRNAISKF